MSKRRQFTAALKGQVAIEAIRERLTLSEIAAKFDVHQTQIQQWKRELLARNTEIFDKKPSNQEKEHEQKIQALYKVIGQVEAERNFLAKASATLLAGRKG